jgi:uncharacterized protein (DUF1697 family)
VIDIRVALLRGINVGKARRIAMADLRGLVVSLGYGDVRTLLNSGNVVFTVPRERRGDPAPRIQTAIATELGVSTLVTVMRGKDLAEAVRGNPFSATALDPSRMLLLVPPEPKALGQLKPLLKQRWAPEELAIGRRLAYLWCAGGVLDSPLWTAVSRSLRDACTARNLTTMTKLAAMIEGSRP